ncbi:MAG: hypothetical protein AAF939_01530 [Planctomycetota bacterium]
MEESDDLVRFAVAATEVDADQLKGILAEYDIQLMTMNSESSAFGVSLEGEDSIELFVNKEDLEKAKAVVEQLMDTEEELAPAWTCHCGEEVDEGFGVCWACGASYDDVHTGGQSDDGRQD